MSAWALARVVKSGFFDLSIKALSTSRRLAVVIDDVPAHQPDRSEDLTGPPVSAAFAADGSPTPAGEGFARKVGRALDDVGRVETPKGEYLAATVVHKGRTTLAILAETIPVVVGAMRFPKMMRWGDGSRQFVRPVHGAVGLLDEEIVPFEIFGIASGRTTFGHRVHAPESFELASARGYAVEMAERGVMVDPDDRRERLETLAETLAEEAGAKVHPDPGLIAEHVELVEWPGLVAGAFEARYLDLPPEVVVTTLRHHQKCLVLEDADGGLQPGFIAVIDRRGCASAGAREDPCCARRIL